MSTIIELPPPPKDRPDETARQRRLKAMFNESRGSYGARRGLKQLRAEGHHIGRYNVRRIMGPMGVKAKTSRRFKLTTDSRQSYPVAPTVLTRDCDVETPNKV